MFKVPLMAGLTLAVFSAHAQVKVELLLDQKQYLLREYLPVGVRIVNHSGQTLQFSGTAWLTFTVEDQQKLMVKQSADLPPPQPFSVDSSYMATQWIDIGQAFDLQDNHSYNLTARVHVGVWNQDFFSEPVHFEIIKGSKLWEQRIGIPGKPGQPPEIRKYLLQQANYLKELQLYVRVTDASESRVFNVLRLGPMIEISQPQAQIDALNQLHVLAQTGMRQFVHVCVDPDGHLVLRNTYEIAGKRPKLEVTKSGGVFVSGGNRMLRLDDIPPSAILSGPLHKQPGSEGGSIPSSATTVPATGSSGSGGAGR